jgi:hypothetical protein
MTATDDLLKSGAPVHDHHAQATGIRMQLLLIKDDAQRKLSLCAAHAGADLVDKIRLGQLMAAAYDFFKAFSAAHDLHDQSATFRVPFEFVDDVAFLNRHIYPRPSPLVTCASAFGLSSGCNPSTFVDVLKGY